MHLLLAESSLELIPKHLQRSPKVLKSSRRLGRPPNKMLLEVTYHREIIRTLPFSEKRGRPDILHTALLFILDSPLNRFNLLNIFIHTINNEIYWVNPKVRIPKTYNRFYGLMVQLLRDGLIKASDTNEILFEKKKTTLNELIEDFDKIILLSEKGSLTSPSELAKIIVSTEAPLVIIGGFPHGDFSEKFYSIATQVAKIYPFTLATWTVASEIIVSIENELHLS